MNEGRELYRAERKCILDKSEGGGAGQRWRKKVKLEVEDASKEGKDGRDKKGKRGRRKERRHFKGMKDTRV